MRVPHRNYWKKYIYTLDCELRLRIFDPWPCAGEFAIEPIEQRFFLKDRKYFFNWDLHSFYELLICPKADEFTMKMLIAIIYTFYPLQRHRHPLFLLRVENWNTNLAKWHFIESELHSASEWLASRRSRSSWHVLINLTQSSSEHRVYSL